MNDSRNKRPDATSIQQLEARVSRLARRLPPPIRRPLGRLKRVLRRNPAFAKYFTSAMPAPTAATAGPSGTVTPPPVPPKPRLQVRRDFVFSTADPAGLALEIGPAHNAILPKREGFNTRTVDYLDRSGLVEKYSSFKQYSPDDIEEVDYVLSAGASMSSVIDDRFDLVLASHVLEHTLSLIDFLNDCTDLLAPNGVLSLVVPDHRYCFDRFRERSSIGRVIDTALNPPSVHTVGTLTDFTLNAVKHRGTTSWAPGHAGKYEFVHQLEQVKANAERARGETYIDVHNWIFSPNHLRLLLQDLYSLGLIRLRESAFQDTIGHEFFLNLQVEGPGTGLSRDELVVLADAEQTSMDVPVFERAPDPPATEQEPGSRPDVPVKTGADQ